MSKWLIRALCVCAALCASGRAGAIDRVVLRHEGVQQEVVGKVLLEAEDKGVLLLGIDGTLWTVPAEDLVLRTEDSETFHPLEPDELARHVLSELPNGFSVHTTEHYVILHNTSRAYAQWCGSLFEQLYRTFNNYWTRRNFDLVEPEFPLLAIVFADKASYTAHAEAELGKGTSSIIGYYSLRTNRMTMYDLTGIETLRRPGDRRNSAAHIQQMLSRPEAERTVATVVHEATHQIAFNCGLHGRYADIPLWVSEGIAVYFETPDPGSSKGWGNIGGVNRVRLAGFRDYLGRRGADSLESLLTSDDRLRDAKTAGDAYAEAWALQYFMFRQRSKEYHAYLRHLATKPPLIWDDASTRLAEFKQYFGDDLRKLDADLVKFMAKVR